MNTNTHLHSSVSTLWSNCSVYMCTPECVCKNRFQILGTLMSLLYFWQLCNCSVTLCPPWKWALFTLKPKNLCNQEKILPLTWPGELSVEAIVGLWLPPCGRSQTSPSMEQFTLWTVGGATPQFVSLSWQTSSFTKVFTKASRSVTMGPDKMYNNLNLN